MNSYLSSSWYNWAHGSKKKLSHRLWCEHDQHSLLILVDSGGLKPSNNHKSSRSSEIIGQLPAISVCAFPAVPEGKQSVQPCRYETRIALPLLPTSLQSPHPELEKYMGNGPLEMLFGEYT